MTHTRFHDAPSPSSDWQGDVVRIIGLCFIVALVEGYDLQAAGLAAIRMGPALHIPRASLGAVFSLGMVGMILGASASGWLADRFGRKPVLMAAVAAFGVFSVATGLARSEGWLIWSRILTGVGLGGAMPNLIAISADISPARRLTLVATLMFCGMPLGGALVAAAAPSLMNAFNWRGVFLIGGLAPIVLLPVLWIFLPEVRRPQTRVATPKPSRSVFGGRAAIVTPLLWAAYFGTLTILYMLLNWLPLLIVGKGIPADQAALASLAFNIASVIGGVSLGWAVDSLSRRLVFGGMYVAMVAAILLLAGAAGAAALIISSAAAGFFVVGAQFILYGVTPSFYPPQSRGLAAGLAVAVGRLGSIAGPLLASLLLARGLGSEVVVRAMIPFALVSGIALVLAETWRNRVSDPTPSASLEDLGGARSRAAASNDLV